MCQPATTRPARTQGMNFVRQTKRLAIYLRDGLACAYCGQGIETAGVTLSLDHLQPYSLGGSNSETNLVTCCTRCNSARGNRPVAAFVAVTAAFFNTDAAAITARIAASTARPLALALAKNIIALRGSCAKAIAAGVYC